MDIAKKYQPQTWQKITRLPFMVAIGIEGAGRSGLSGSTRERRATLEAILAARTDYPGNPIICEILPKDGEEQALVAGLAQHDQVMDAIHEAGLRTTEDLWNHSIDCLHEVIPAMKKHEAGHTVTDYAKWLLEIARQVAEAAKEGDFMGIGGQRFSAREQEYVKRLEQALQEADPGNNA